MSSAGTRLFNIGELVERILATTIQLELQEMPVTQVMRLLFRRQLINSKCLTTINESSDLARFLWLLADEPPSPSSAPADLPELDRLNLNPAGAYRSFTEIIKEFMPEGSLNPLVELTHYSCSSTPDDKVSIRLLKCESARTLRLEYSTDIADSPSWSRMIMVKKVAVSQPESLEVYAHEGLLKNGSKLVWLDLKVGMTVQEVYDQIMRGGKSSFE